MYNYVPYVVSGFLFIFYKFFGEDLFNSINLIRSPLVSSHVFPSVYSILMCLSVWHSLPASVIRIFFFSSFFNSCILATSLRTQTYYKWTLKCVQLYPFMYIRRSEKKREASKYMRIFKFLKYRKNKSNFNIIIFFYPEKKSKKIAAKGFVALIRFISS